jgi:putative addiction module component (TIGR02574 family)
MSFDSTSIFDTALNLSEDDRASLAFQLIQSLKPTTILDEDDPQMDSVLRRRIEKYENGEVDAADWDDVAARLRQALDRK